MRIVSVHEMERGEKGLGDWLGRDTRRKRREEGGEIDV
jgi:hypothetical protein